VVILKGVPLSISDFGQLLLFVSELLTHGVDVGGSVFFSELVCSEFVHDWNS
jgi:hypothetical protein